MRRILCYGDSNTFGAPPLERLGEDRRFDANTRWPGVMRNELGEGFEIIEEGLPGRTTCYPDPVDGAFMDGLAVLPAILKSHKPLDLVIIMLGTNDQKERFRLTGFDIGAGMRNLIACVPTYIPDVPILSVCPPPAYESGCLAEMFKGSAERGKTMPHWYAHFATETGASFFDAGTVIACDPLDGVHFGADAHGTLGKAMAEQVRKVLRG